MKEKINEDILCVLRKNNANHIIIDYVNIINPFKYIIDKLSDLCDRPETTIPQILNYIQNTKDFEQLNAHYKYCVSLEEPWQGFLANNQDFIEEINKSYKSILPDEILFNELILPYQKYLDPKIIYASLVHEASEELKIKIQVNYILWNKAFAINKTYRLCHQEKCVLAFSHRICGWSNPIHQLTENFSIEIKTNFGYGKVSYFYTKLKYKNIEIMPFSEWINYEFALFSEIILYTRSYPLVNEFWLDAMEFSQDACNLSLTDEVKFVEKYVLNECEEMVSGLEDLFHKTHFTFKSRERRKYSVDKNRHGLAEFRGEKISGALDFISKISEFDSIANINTFITRIEDCNRRIQPILIEEVKILKIEIENSTKEKNELQPKFDEVVKIKKDYDFKLSILEKEMITKKELIANQIDYQKLVTTFISEYPDYLEFTEEYKRVTNSFRILTEQIQNNIKVKNKIVSYNEKITQYFGK